MEGGSLQGKRKGESRKAAFCDLKRLLCICRPALGELQPGRFPAAGADGHRGQGWERELGSKGTDLFLTHFLSAYRLPGTAERAVHMWYILSFTATPSSCLRQGLALSPFDR